MAASKRSRSAAGVETQRARPRVAFSNVAWVLFGLALILPAPRSFYPNREIVAGGLFVVGMAGQWVRKFPAGFGTFHFAGLLVFALALFANVIFAATSVTRHAQRVPMAWKVMMIASVALGAAVPIFFPVFAMLLSYWLWMAAFVTMTWSLFVAPGSPAANVRLKGSVSEEVPALVWIWLACMLFWSGVTTVNYVQFRARQRVAAPARQMAVRPAALKSYFNDPAGTFAPAVGQRIEQQLAEFEKSTSSQIAVAVYPRSPEIPVEEFTLQTAVLSRLGRAGRDNGAILFVFLDRKIARVEVGYGLEDTLTDATARRILEEKLGFALHAGQLEQGVDGALAAILQTVGAEYRNDQQAPFAKVAAQKIKIGLSKVARQIWPFLKNAPLDARIGISFFGSLIGLGVWSGLVNGGKLVGALGRAGWNAVRRRPLRSGIAQVDFEPIWDTLKLAVFVVAVIAAGVFVAGGGTFGGGGAQIHW